MGVSAPAASKANGLSTVGNVFTAPGEAFETLRIAPTWGWAVALAIVLMCAGAFLQGPAARHAGVAQVQHMIATNPMYASVSDAQKQQIVERAGKPSIFVYAGVIVTLFIAVLLNTVILLIGNAVGRGQADFKRLWCGSMNIAVPTLGVGAVVLGIIVAMRGPDAFSNAFQIAQAVPSLGMLAPASNPVLATFLSAVSVFTLWGFFLNAAMLRVMGKTSPAVAYTFAAIVLILGAFAAAGGAAFSHRMGMI